MQLIGEFKPDTFCEICAKTVGRLGETQQIKFFQNSQK